MMDTGRYVVVCFTCYAFWFFPIQNYGILFHHQVLFKILGKSMASVWGKNSAAT